MFELISTILYTALSLYSLYFVFTDAFAFIDTKPKRLRSKKQNYFCILIAARNEEKVIGNLIKSLKAMDYDKRKYEINVIINNCTDHTKEEALKAGAKVIECQRPINRKGQALEEAFEYTSDNKKIDAYVIFDADNVVNDQFLKLMNDSINRGFKVAQGFRDIKNIDDNWITISYGIWYYVENFFYNRSRRFLNASAAINGSGFMITKKLIDKYGFNTKTLTEDIELTCLCAIKNVKVDFVEDARFYDEEPDNLMVSCKQRLRWTKGSLQCMNRYFKGLIKGAFQGKLTCVDMLFRNASALVQCLSIVTVITTIIYTLYYNATNIVINSGFVTNFIVLFSNSILLCCIAYIAQVLIGAFVLAYYKKDLFDLFYGIVLFPLFVATWVPVNVVALVKRNLTWEHIEHSRDISIEEIK